MRLLHRHHDTQRHPQLGLKHTIRGMQRRVKETAPSRLNEAPLSRVSYGAGEPFWFPSWVISRAKKHRTFLNSCSAKWLPHPRLETGLKMGKQKLCTPHAALLHCQIYMTNKVSHLYEYCGISISFARDD